MSSGRPPSVIPNGYPSYFPVGSYGSEMTIQRPHPWAYHMSTNIFNPSRVPYGTSNQYTSSLVPTMRPYDKHQKVMKEYANFYPHTNPFGYITNNIKRSTYLQQTTPMSSSFAPTTGVDWSFPFLQTHTQRPRLEENTEETPLNHTASEFNHNVNEEKTYKPSSGEETSTVRSTQQYPMKSNSFLSNEGDSATTEKTIQDITNFILDKVIGHV